MEAGKRAVARPHLLRHDPAVSGTKEVRESACEDGRREPIRGRLNRLGLTFDDGKQIAAFGKVIGGRRHGVGR